MTDVYLIHLTGQGDVEIKLVGKPTFDWLTTRDAPLPASLKDSKDIPRWYGSSPDNDRALVAPPEYGEIFDSISEMMKYARKNKLRVRDEYTGVIY